MSSSVECTLEYDESSSKKAPTSRSKKSSSSNTTTANSKKSNSSILLPLSSYSNILSQSTEEDGKKKGRKPRGAKMISKSVEQIDKQAEIVNIILHLRCSLNDLYHYNSELDKMVKDPYKYIPDVPSEIQTFQDITPSLNFYQYDNKNNSHPILIDIQQQQDNESSNKGDEYIHKDGKLYLCSICQNKSESPRNTNYLSPIDTHNVDDKFEIDDSHVSLKESNLKLKQLKLDLYKNAVEQDIKSACFWCTYDFDNTPCRIPRYIMDTIVYGYGSFCRPECAVAFLMKENIDDSTKFERYHLLCQIYSPVYNCNKNIKPAPNPYYTLDKYFGTLSIQEWRKMLKTEHLLMVIDKPMTRVLPELHEDNEEILLNVYGIQKTQSNSGGNSVYKVKRQSEKQGGPSKSAILKSKFCVSGNT